MADTASRQPGIDLVLQRGGERLYVEVKGWPSSTYARGPQAGRPKPTNPTVQARHWFAGALLSAMLMRDAEPSSRVALAFPDVARYRDLLARTAASLATLRFEVILVDDAGQIEVINPQTLPIDRRIPTVPSLRPRRRSAEASGHAGKYRALWEWLRAQPDDSVEMTFTEVEDVLGFPLPSSCYKHSAHWVSYEGSAVARAVVDAGWKAHPDLSRQRVAFIRPR